MEAIIARCLDNDPDKRPSARELVEFMVHLPQQLSLDSASTGTEGSNDRSSSESTHLTRLSRQGLLVAGSMSTCKGSCGNMCHQLFSSYMPITMGPGSEALCREIYA